MRLDCQLTPILWEPRAYIDNLHTRRLPRHRCNDRSKSFNAAARSPQSSLPPPFVSTPHCSSYSISAGTGFLSSSNRGVLELSSIFSHQYAANCWLISFWLHLQQGLDSALTCFLGCNSPGMGLGVAFHAFMPHLRLWAG